MHSVFSDPIAGSGTGMTLCKASNVPSVHSAGDAAEFMVSEGHDWHDLVQGEQRTFSVRAEFTVLPTSKR
jgi:hypothetical protein